MKAVRVHAPGGDEALRYEEIPDASPGPGQALVRVEASGVNFIDVYHRTGLYKVPLPVILGREGRARFSKSPPTSATSRRATASPGPAASAATPRRPSSRRTSS